MAKRERVDKVDDQGRHKMGFVKNKAPAPIQITAEQIMREALDQVAPPLKPPKQQITDPDELAEYRARKRREFEDRIRMNRNTIGTWIKYAQWEESQRDFVRVRSIYERILDEDYKNIGVWIKYAEFEMRNRNVNHARNIFDRAVTLLPRLSQLWYKYIFLEDILGNYAGARQIWERWMDWEPDQLAWNAYIKFEVRNREIDRARQIWERFIVVHPVVTVWIKYAKWEAGLGQAARARLVFERAIEYLGEEANDERLFIAFAKFEERMKEPERARAIYRYALDHIEKELAPRLYQMFVAFEKQTGDRAAIDDAITNKRRFEYEQQLRQDPQNYDVWFDYARLEEGSGTAAQVREVYERAIANRPPSAAKRHWKRYIYLWINYAIYEELECRDVARAREVYRAVLALVPHRQFSFAKLWLLAVNFEVRQKDLPAARKLFGRALGLAPSEKLYRAYIRLELQLGEVDRCRTLYQKYLGHQPDNCQAWIRFAEMERDLRETRRARQVFELAVAQPVLDTPAELWKAYIDFEMREGEHERAKGLYLRLLDKTKHPKVWISYAQYHSSLGQHEAARNVYEDAAQHFKAEGQVEERVLLLEAWRAAEELLGDKEYIEAVLAKQPKKVKKKRQIKSGDGMDAGWEEYFDYIFPGEGQQETNLRLLQMAHAWKKQKVAT